MEEPELCYSCHQDVELDFAQRNGHDLGEGDMKCSSCHTAHGGPGGDVNKTLKKHTPLAARAGDLSNETCVSCHAEKEGPFVNQHSSVVAEEGCASCHTPHGSQNRFMLKHQRSDMLCRECHGTMPSFHYDDAGLPNSDAKIVESGSRENCTTCHGTIHGSNQDFMMMDE
jgi:DmsE family decaheme c-type cytochrome